MSNHYCTYETNYYNILLILPGTNYYACYYYKFTLEPQL